MCEERAVGVLHARALSYSTESTAGWQVLLLREHMLRFPHEHVQCKSLHAPGQPFSRFKSISDESQYRTPHELIVGAEL